MTLTPPTAGAVKEPEADARAAVWLVTALTLARLIALFRTPLELYPDEAQYWLWSRALAFGYYSKPPVVAWAIWASTAFGGDAEPWVRLPAVLFQAGATLLVFGIGRRLYSARVGLAAAALYALAPAVQLSALVVATDAPLLFFLGLSMLAYVNLQGAQGRRRLALAAGLGAALGLAFLSKYAAVYAVIGVGLHLLLSRSARRSWSPGAAGVAIAAFLLVLSPNLAWNAANGFATVAHTAADAHWRSGQLFNPRELGEFLGEQFAVFGPIPFGVLVVGAALMAWRRRLEPPDVLLLCFVAPPLVIVAAQAFVSRANANWSAASYLPGAVVAAAWLMRWRARRLMIAAFATQAVIVAAFLALVVSPRLADSLGGSNSLKRARGWSQTADAVVRRARVESPAGLSAIAVNNRFLYYSLAYYGRAYFREPLAAPLRIWIRGAGAGNQAEASAPLTPSDGQRVLVVAIESWFDSEIARDFTRALGREIDNIWLDRKHERRLEMFVGEGFSPRPRDPKTGYPSPQWTPSDASSPLPTRP
ncbi:MAG TPA: glycosyltransferase family 39 protein [Phenylobacterium sp.]|jgi:4-amino-4-deoxy-L-arabinose transferase-like glycosyltransferase